MNVANLAGIPEEIIVKADKMSDEVEEKNHFDQAMTNAISKFAAVMLNTVDS